jgi:hypothetical protein
MHNQALNFVLYVLPKLKKKGNGRIKHLVHRVISKTQLDNSIGSRDYIINKHWEEMYSVFKEEGISPSHYEQYEIEAELHLKLIAIEDKL